MRSDISREEIRKLVQQAGVTDEYHWHDPVYYAVSEETQREHIESIKTLKNLEVTSENIEKYAKQIKNFEHLYAIMASGWLDDQPEAKSSLLSCLSSTDLKGYVTKVGGKFELSESYGRKVASQVTTGVRLTPALNQVRRHGYSPNDFNADDIIELLALPSYVLSDNDKVKCFFCAIDKFRPDSYNKGVGLNKLAAIFQLSPHNLSDNVKLRIINSLCQNSGFNSLHQLFMTEANYSFPRAKNDAYKDEHDGAVAKKHYANNLRLLMLPTLRKSFPLFTDKEKIRFSEASHQAEFFRAVYSGCQELIRQMVVADIACRHTEYLDEISQPSKFQTLSDVVNARYFDDSLNDVRQENFRRVLETYFHSTDTAIEWSQMNPETQLAITPPANHSHPWYRDVTKFAPIQLIQARNEEFLSEMINDVNLFVFLAFESPDLSAIHKSWFIKKFLVGEKLGVILNNASDLQKLLDIPDEMLPLPQKGRIIDCYTTKLFSIANDVKESLRRAKEAGLMPRVTGDASITEITDKHLSRALTDASQSLLSSEVKLKELGRHISDLASLDESTLAASKLAEIIYKNQDMVILVARAYRSESPVDLTKREEITIKDAITEILGDSPRRDDILKEVSKLQSQDRKNNNFLQAQPAKEQTGDNPESLATRGNFRNNP